MNDNTHEAARHTLTFIRNTVLGHERGLFKANKTGVLNYLNLRKLTPQMEMAIKIATVSYFNMVYEKLISKDDPYVISIFNRYAELINHSPNCLIGMLFRFCLQVNLALDRSRFVVDGIDGVESYEMSVREQLDNILEEGSVMETARLFNHPCSGDREVKPLPPGQKFFQVSEKKPDHDSGAIDISFIRKCFICGKANSKKCGRCGLKYYCSKECQKLDWKHHKPYCNKPL